MICRTAGLTESSTQHRANPDDDQINYCHHDRDLNQRYRQADQHAQHAEGDAGGGQNEGDAHRQNKQRQQDNSHYLQNIRCFFHLFYLIPFALALSTGLSYPRQYTTGPRQSFRKTLVAGFQWHRLQSVNVFGNNPLQTKVCAT
jgi:hypothetical protein